MSLGEQEGVKVRPLQRKDIFPVLTMLHKMDWRGTLTERDLQEYCVKGQRPSLSFIAKVDDQIVGLLLGRFALWGVPVIEMGIIHVLAVAPDYQRKHIASKLVNAVFDCCFAEGISQVRTHINQRDWELATFTENMGFKPSGLVEYTKNIEV